MQRNPAGTGRAGIPARTKKSPRNVSGQSRGSFRSGNNSGRKESGSKQKFHLGKMDISFFFLTVTLVSIGLVMVFSASYATSFYENKGDSLAIAGKQALFVLVGFIGMIIASYVPYQLYKKFAFVIYIVSVGLMLFALVFSDEDSVGKAGARRWIPIPGIGTFQPSELMKFALIIFLAGMISVNYRRMDSFKYGFLYFIPWIAIPAGAAVLQRHLSGMLLLAIIGFGMIFIAGTKMRYILISGALFGVCGAGYLMMKGFDYLTTRFHSWLNPFENIQNESWQICQSLLAIGSGGLMGVGLGNSTQKFLWVSEPQNDMIFAIICEELGLVGAVAIILLFVLFVCSGFSIAMRAPDRFSCMVVTGIVLQLGVQALLNIAVVSNAMPTTGISLPFFSAGGTATIMQLCQAGVVLNISRQCRPSLSSAPVQDKKAADAASGKSGNKPRSAGRKF